MTTEVGPGGRLLALAAGVLLGLVALWTGAWALVASSQLRRPDPAAADGDPCCAHPDDWGDVAFGAVFTAGLAGVALLLFVLAAALGATALFGDPPSPRRAARWCVPVVAVVVVFGAATFALV